MFDEHQEVGYNSASKSKNDDRPGTPIPNLQRLQTPDGTRTNNDDAFFVASGILASSLSIAALSRPPTSRQHKPTKKGTPTGVPQFVISRCFAFEVFRSIATQHPTLKLAHKEPGR